MALKQASLFDFESPAPSETKLKDGEARPHSKREEKADPGIEEIPNPIIIDEEIREVEILPVVKTNARDNTVKPRRGRMKLADMDNLEVVELPGDDELFSKRYYNIGAVSEMFRVNVSLIRFWENEFDILKPKKNGKGDRLFRPEDIKNLKIIYHLLREKKYTIEGAKDFIRNNKRIEENFALVDSLKKLQSFLLELKATL